MYQLILGQISTLSALPLPTGLADQAPDGPRRASWLAGRALLAHAAAPL
ncbi:ACP synthase, partial [Klebsiella pneumoniae]